jgi:uncharacterized protein YcaQ
MFKRRDRMAEVMEHRRIGWSAAALLALVLGVSASAPVARAQTQPRNAQVTIREQLIIRVPVRTPQMTPSAGMFSWKEHKGPRCLPLRYIAAAAHVEPNSVDFILRDRRRVRARLDKRCPDLDRRYGFYISPNPDGQLCQDRDIIRTRIGGQCDIERFRNLEAVRRGD